MTHHRRVTAAGPAMYRDGATMEELMRFTTKGLNNRGQIVGSYTDAVGNTLGRLAHR